MALVSGAVTAGHSRVRVRARRLVIRPGSAHDELRGQVEVEHHRGLRARGCREDRGLLPGRQIARGIDAGHGRLTPHRIDTHVSVLIELELERLDEVDLSLRWMGEERLAGDGRPARQLDALERSIARDQSCDPGGLESDPGGGERPAIDFGDLECVVREDREVARPGSRLQRKVGQHRGLGRTREVPPRAVLHLPAVTIRALEDRARPQLAEAVDREHLIDHSGREEDAARPHDSSLQRHLERSARARDRQDPCITHLYARVLPELVATDAPELTGRRAVARDEVVEVLRCGVPSRPGVTQQDTLARDPERERSGEARRATSNDDDVVGHDVSSFRE
jgi:hypothetical protein